MQAYSDLAIPGTEVLGPSIIDPLLDRCEANDRGKKVKETGGIDYSNIWPSSDKQQWIDRLNLPKLFFPLS